MYSRKHIDYQELTHIYSLTHARAHTQSKISLAAAKQSHQPSEALGYLGTTQVLRASAGKFTWGRASTPQVELYHVPG